MPGLSLEELQGLIQQREQQRTEGFLSPLIFPVIKIPFSLGLLVGSPIESLTSDAALSSDEYAMIVRTDTNKILGVHSPTYGVMTNKKVFEMAKTMISDMGLFILNDGTAYKDTVIKEGAAGYRTYRVRGPLPEGANEEPDALLLDEIQGGSGIPEAVIADRLCITVMNSYNGLWPVQFYFSSTPISVPYHQSLNSPQSRIVNTTSDSGEFYLIAPEDTVAFGKHTSGMSAVRITRRAQTALNDYLRFFRENQQMDFMDFHPRDLLPLMGRNEEVLAHFTQKVAALFRDNNRLRPMSRGVANYLICCLWACNYGGRQRAGGVTEHRQQKRINEFRRHMRHWLHIHEPITNNPDTDGDE